MNTEYQSFRVFPDGPITRIEVIFDEEYGQKVIFWDDIQIQFSGMHCIRNGDIAISFLRDSKYKIIEPRRIKYHPGIVLDVITSGSNGHESPLRYSASCSVSSLSIHSTINDPDGGTSVAQSFNNVSVGTSLPFDDQWQRQYDSPLTREHNDIKKSVSSTSRGSSNVSRTPSTSKAPCPSNLPCDSSLVTSTLSQGPNLHSLNQASHILENFEHSIKSGQESIRQDIISAVIHIKEDAAKKHEEQMEISRQIAQETHDRLASIQNRLQVILTQTFELHEYPIPRLFIVLPDEVRQRDRIMNPFTNRFKLHFLCECGDHTMQSPRPMHNTGPSDWNTLGSWDSNSTASVESSSSSRDGAKAKPTSHIHLAKHEGYEIDRPTEFFQKYGNHILTLLNMMKYSVFFAGIVIPQLAHLRIMEGIDKTRDGLDYAEKSFEPKLDFAIKYLEGLAAGLNITTTDTFDSLSRDMADSLPGDQGPYRSRGDSRSNDTFSDLEALEGADLRHLSSFLKIKDESKVLGNLYRTVTHEGHVKWVCVDHFRENYRESATRQLQEAISINKGVFEEALGKVSIRFSSGPVAKQFYESLERAKFIQELSLVLDWECTLDDLRSLQETIRKTNIAILRIDFCNTQSPSWDLFNRSRRYDPIFQIMGNTKLQALHLLRCDGFWSRSTKSILLSIPTILLRVFSIQGAIENWKADQIRMINFLKHCPRLIDLKLQCWDVDATFDLIKNATAGFQGLQSLELSVNQSDRQEQVNIVISQPQAEISSIIISTSSRPYTRLLYSGYVHEVSIYNEFSLVVDRQCLERIIQQNQHLQEIGIRCSIHELVPVFEFVWARAIYNKHLRLVKIQDIEGRNEISSADLKDSKATALKLLSSESAGREEILGAYGWALRKIPLGMQLNAELLTALEGSMFSKGSILQSLHIDISTFDEDSLELLARVIQLSQPTLTKLSITIHNTHASIRDFAMAPIARFIIRVSSQITRLHLKMYGLSQFLYGLYLAATASQAASTSLSRTYTLSDRERVA
ncbi:hypothetical protein BGZ76_009995 [Entomortierella beljakovae]|nr:hypothetical protein BGZ76_009995 [Entomortierella beljakovae]